MDITIFPSKLSGTIQAIPSKSQAHRLLICAAFADRETHLICRDTNQDIEATVTCLNAIGAKIRRTNDGYHIVPATQFPNEAVLQCGESGSTLRFLLPVIGALGICGTFILSGRLADRPLSPLWEEMERMGCNLHRSSNNSIVCSGQLKAGNYSIAGNISSQFISGLLFAMALLKGESKLAVTGKPESEPYIQMTLDALHLFGVSCDNFTVTGCSPFTSPGLIEVEGDWSNAAFFMAANAVNGCITIVGLNDCSAQGDRAVSKWIPALKSYCHIDCADIPDLVPILSVVAAANQGAVFQNIQRLRLKESDRVSSILKMLRSLGIHVEATYDTITVSPGNFSGGIVDSYNDHRIAMAAAIAATAANGPVKIINALCVSKSYPGFWEAYQRSGGNYEQHIW